MTLKRKIEILKKMEENANYLHTMFVRDGDEFNATSQIAKAMALKHCIYMLESDDYAEELEEIWM